MEKVLSYKTLLEFLKLQWEQNYKYPSLRIQRDAFVDAFEGISFTFINQLLRDLDERYHAIRVGDYAYSEKWEDGAYMDLSASEILEQKGSKPTLKNIDAINQTILTTSLVIEPNFLDILKSFENPWQEPKEASSVESLATAKLKLSGRTFLIEFEGKKAEIWTYKSRKYKGYIAIKTLLEAKGAMLLKNGLTAARLSTNTTQLVKLMHLEKEMARIFYRHNKTHAALNYKVELNHHDAQLVRNYVNRKVRQKRES